MKKDANYITGLVEYIKKNLKKGYTKESLKWALVNQGHSKIEVEKALTRAESELASEAPILEIKPEIKVELIEPKAQEKISFWKKLFGS